MATRAEAAAVVEAEIRESLCIQATHVMRDLMRLANMDPADAEAVDTALTALDALGCTTGLYGLYGLDRYDDNAARREVDHAINCVLDDLDALDRADAAQARADARALRPVVL